MSAGKRLSRNRPVSYADGMKVGESTINIVALVAAGAVAIAMLIAVGQSTCSEPASDERNWAGLAQLDVTGADDTVVERDNYPGLRAAQVAQTATGVAEDIAEHNERSRVDRPVLDLPEITQSLQDQRPEQWGERVDGVQSRLDTDADKMALTFDACDRGYDAELIELLREHDIDATLFVSGHFADGRRQTLQELADDPLFEIANHGLRHLPCSVTGESFLEIEGTGSIEEAYREISGNADKIEDVIGERPAYYRSGTAHYDEICTEVARMTGHSVAGFDVIGDQGATYSAEEVRQTLVDANPGSVVVLHMNKPVSGTTDGLRQALPELQQRGVEFVRLSDVGLGE